MSKQEKKTLGWGSLSLLLFVAGSMFSHLTINKKLVGEHVLDYFNLNIHEAIITAILLILAVFLGKRFRSHIFAKIGSILSLMLLGLFAISIIIGAIKFLINLF